MWNITQEYSNTVFIYRISHPDPGKVQCLVVNVKIPPPKKSCPVNPVVTKWTGWLILMGLGQAVVTNINILYLYFVCLLILGSCPGGKDESKFLLQFSLNKTGNITEFSLFQYAKNIYFKCVNIRWFGGIFYMKLFMQQTITQWRGLGRQTSKWGFK